MDQISRYLDSFSWQHSLKTTRKFERVFKNVLVELELIGREDWEIWVRIFIRESVLGRSF